MTPTTRRRKQEQDQALQQAMLEATTPLESKSQKLPVRAKDDELPSSPNPNEESPVSKRLLASTKSQVISFDDEEEDRKMQKAAAQPKSASKSSKSKKVVQEEPEEPEDEDDDDDAPEAVSTQKVANEVKQSSLAAQKKVQEQAAQQKRKRQQRDTLFKQQAAERKTTQDEIAPAAPKQTLGRKRSEKLHIPDVLPAEFLTDSSSEDEEEGHEDTVSLKAKRRKVSTVERQLTRLDRHPKDEIVGNTIYRVARKTDERMAPKSRKHAMSFKDQLLKRNRAAVASKPGFFTKRK